MRRSKALIALLLCGAVSVNADVVRTRPTGSSTAAAVTPGTTTVTGCQNRVIYGDNSSVLNCEAALGYVASTNTLTADIVTVPAGTNAATSINFGTAGTGIYSSAGAVNIDFASGTTNVFRVGASSLTAFGATTLSLAAQGLTASTMTAETTAQVRSTTHSYTWSNAQVAALGATTTGDINVATLPAKTQVLDALVVITGAAAGPTTVTVSCGDAIAGTPFINYVVASDAKAAANTVYGDAVAERGTSLDAEFWYLPSYTATTLVTCHFISTGANLSTVTGSTGRVILTTRLLP